MAMIGGGGLAYLFRVKNTGGVLSLVKADGTTAATSYTDAALKIGGDYEKNNILIQSNFETSDDGKLTVKLNQTKFDSAFNTFMKACNPRTAGTTTASTEELTDETGYKVGGAAAASTVDLLLVSYSGSDSENNVQIVVAMGNVSKTLTFDYSANTYVKPNIEFTSKAISAEAGLTIPVGLFDGSKVDLIGTGSTLKTGFTLAKNTLWDIAVCPKAA